MKNAMCLFILFSPVFTWGQFSLKFTEGENPVPELTIQNIITMVDMQMEDWEKSLQMSGYSFAKTGMQLKDYEKGSPSEDTYHVISKGMDPPQVIFQLFGSTYRTAEVVRFCPFNLLIDSLRSYFMKDLADGGLAFIVPRGSYSYQMIIQRNEACLEILVTRFLRKNKKEESLQVKLAPVGGIYTGKVQSPDGDIITSVSLEQDRFTYELSFKGKMIIGESQLGLIFKESIFSERLVFGGCKQLNNDTVWKPVYGKSSMVHDHYNQLSVELADKSDLNKRIIIHFRVFDDGVAFRYELHELDEREDLYPEILPELYERKDYTLVGEKTEFRFTDNFTAWAVARKIDFHNPGPLPVSEISHVRLPITIKVRDDCWVSLNEASLFDYSTPLLISSADKLVKTLSIDAVKPRLPFRSPWRVIQVAESAAELVESNILVNLNKPCRIEDPSWVIPGKCMWNWRCNQSRVGDFIYGANEESYKRLIDFASENGIKYVLLGGQWKRIIESMPRIVQYANSRGVGVHLYYDRRDKDMDWDPEKVLQLFSNWGVKGLKYGFLVDEPDVRERGSAYYVQRTFEIVELCARYRMMVNFHDYPIHPSGDERTWPNFMTREYCWAQQDNRVSFNPVTAVTVPFVNHLSGGLDITNGFYDLDHLHERLAVDKNGLNSTVTSETARCLVMWAPLLILADHGEAYNAKADLFEFIREMPDTWDETLGLAGYPGQYISVARRSGDAWFVGTVNNEEGRKLDIPLNFLGKGNYTATIYADAPDTHYITNKESYEISFQTVQKDDIIHVRMAPGGGHCMWIRPE